MCEVCVLFSPQRDDRRDLVLVWARPGPVEAALEALHAELRSAFPELRDAIADAASPSETLGGAAPSVSLGAAPSESPDGAALTVAGTTYQVFVREYMEYLDNHDNGPETVLFSAASLRATVELRAASERLEKPSEPRGPQLTDRLAEFAAGAPERSRRRSHALAEAITAGPDSLLAAAAAARAAPAGAALYNERDLMLLQDALFYDFPRPTLVPTGWPRAAGAVGVVRRFEGKFAEASEVLRVLPGVAVAGGAAAWAFGDGSYDPGDVDFFVYGNDVVADPAARWRRAAAVADVLQTALLAGGAECVTQELRPGALTLVALYAAGAPRKFQVVLRAYRSLSAMLHSFDVPACAVAFMGGSAHMTALAAYAHAHMVNIVDLATRSPSFERRLVKYFGRGYALQLGLPQGALERDAPLQLPYLTLRPTAVCGNFAAGHVELPAGMRAAGMRAAASAYEDGRDGPDGPAGARAPAHALRTAPIRAAWAPLRMNAEALAKALASALAEPSSVEAPKCALHNVLELAVPRAPVAPRFAVLGYVSKYATRAAGREARWLWRREVARPVPLAAYAARPPALGDLVGRETLRARLEAAARNVIDGNGRVNAKVAVRLFNIPPENLAVLTAAAARSHAPLSALRALGARIDALMAAYDARAAAPIAWWHGTAPSSAWEMTVISAAAWYGPAMARAADAQVDNGTVAVSLAATLAFAARHRQRPVSDACAFCFDAIAPGGANTATLGCNHTFHLIETDNCAGLRAWLGGPGTCPLCRAPAAPARPAPHSAARPELAFEL